MILMFRVNKETLMDSSECLVNNIATWDSVELPDLTRPKLPALYIFPQKIGFVVKVTVQSRCTQLN